MNKVDEKDLAWAAGFFDGEGYVTIGKRRRYAKNGKVYENTSLRCGINHVAPQPVYEMQRILGGNIELGHKVVGNRKPRCRWICVDMQAASALEKLLPYLRNKQEVAKLGLEYRSTIQMHKKKVPEEVVNLRNQLKDKIQELNNAD